MRSIGSYGVEVRPKSIGSYGIELCPKCKGMFHTSYNNVTGEYNDSCSWCGFAKYAHLLCDVNGNWIRRDIEYPLDGSVFLGVVLDDGLIWSKPLLDIFPNDIIWLFLNRQYFNKEYPPVASPDWMSHIFYSKGFSAIFHRTVYGKTNPLLGMCDSFRFERDTDGVPHFFIEKAAWNIGTRPGNGLMSIVKTDGNCDVYEVGEKTRFEILKMWNELHVGNMPHPESYLTWLDKSTGILQCLHGSVPIDEEYANPPLSEAIPKSPQPDGFLNGHAVPF